MRMPNSYFGIKILETSAFRKIVVSNEKKKSSFASKNSITSCHVLCFFRLLGFRDTTPISGCLFEFFHLADIQHTPIPPKLRPY
jgi:hypothetical protein